MPGIRIGGLAPFTTIDYPGRLAAVLFLTGCPLRCAYCSNPHLLEPKPGEYDPEKIIEWLRARMGRLEAVVFSGGEALMQDAVADFMRQVREMGFLIGLHTNGFYPEALRDALPSIDWTGLDFKGTKENYARLTSSGTAYDKMLRSLDFLVRSGKSFEVRITCDPRFVSKSDVREIAGICAEMGVKNIALQKYIPHFETPGDATTASERNQFFNDRELRDCISGLFSSAAWRAA